MTQITPWSDTALRARRVLRVLDRNDGVCLKRELDHVGRSLEPGPELPSFEAERWELFECIIGNLRGADPLTGPGRTQVGIRLLKHLAGDAGASRPLKVEGQHISAFEAQENLAS